MAGNLEIIFLKMRRLRVPVDIHFRFASTASPIEIKLKFEKLKDDKSDSKYKNADVDIFIDPGTGKVNGTRSPESGIAHWIAKLHTNLHAGKSGRWLVGIFWNCIAGNARLWCHHLSEFCQEKKHHSCTLESGCS